MKNTSPDINMIRTRLEASKGPDYWRSLEELADTEEFQALMHQEFPQQIEEIKSNPVSRRNFLKFMGASLALAGVSACTRQPAERIFPYVQAPEEITPGTPLYFASGFTHGGVATGILVESHMGRPTKIEGNPDHPASLGAADAFAQASVLGLYDPDRSQAVIRRGRISTWEAFLAESATAISAQQATQGAGLRILTETVTSPTLGQQLRDLLAAYPQARWHQYEPIHRDNVREGARLAFGEEVSVRYLVANADVILSLDSDFLTTGPGAVRYARDFATKRDATAANPELNRLYAVESTPTLTGTMADHRLSRRVHDIERIARMIASGLGVQVSSESPSDDRISRWVSAVVADLQQHIGAGLVIAGDNQPPVVHALAHAMNRILDNVGKTVEYTDPVEVQPVNQTESMRDLVKDMADGKVELLVILGGNPAFTAPSDLEFVQHMDNVPLRIQMGLYRDETAERCHWHIPSPHPLESWGDARAYDGTVTMFQPLIAPLYGGKTHHEFLATLIGQTGKKDYDVVREYWQNVGTKTLRSAGSFETLWQTAIHDGLIAETRFPAKSVTVRDVPVFASAPSSPSGMDLMFAADPTIWDGCYANNGWLQELPKPLTKLVWDNAALVSPQTAKDLVVTNGDVIELTHQNRTVPAPVWILPGHPDDAVTVHLGYGRRRAGKLGTDAGFNAYAIRTADTPWFGTGVQVRKTGDRYALHSTQDHHVMDLKGLGGLETERNLIRTATLDEYERNHDVIHAMGHDPDPGLTLYPDDHQYDGPNAWGMVIDLNKCNGCSACVVACQSENNIPVVGKEEVGNARELHWIRIDRYYSGDLDDPETYHQPVPCMHCENAPCELVCPVGATVHSKEGLNDMVYNRCVGTRYCANNCPYKVRRFNFYLYADFETPQAQLGRNPDVTVRSRGIMEKCTYCVQRINLARIDAKKEDRAIRDGEILTACQQACPSQAITFGNIKDSDSRVSKLRASDLNYGTLADLNVKPRTTYLGQLRNPNPALET